MLLKTFNHNFLAKLTWQEDGFYLVVDVDLNPFSFILVVDNNYYAAENFVSSSVIYDLQRCIENMVLQNNYFAIGMMLKGFCILLKEQLGKIE